MKKSCLLIILFLFSGITDVFSDNSYYGNLNYNGNSVNCLNQTINTISGVKYIPIINNLSAAVSDNDLLCQSYGYFSNTLSDYINKNTTKTCDDLGFIDGYASEIICYDGLNNIKTCSANGIGWSKYKLRCMRKFNDDLVQLNSIPLQDRSIIADGQKTNIEISFPLSVDNLESYITSIDFQFDINDNTSLNWFSKSKNTLLDSAVQVVDNTLSDIFIGNIRTIKYSLIKGLNYNNMKSLDKFTFLYKFYNATEVASDIFPAPNDGFVYNTIKYTINFNDGGKFNGFYVEDDISNKNIGGIFNPIQIPIKVKPLIEITNSGELVSTGVLEGFKQISGIAFQNNNTNINIFEKKLYISLTGSSVNPNIQDYFTGTGKINNNIEKNIDKYSLVNIFISNFDYGINYVLETLFTLLDGNGLLDDLKDLKIREFVQYLIDGKTIVYLAGILNNNNNQSIEVLKIYGITNINLNKQKDLLYNQDKTNVQNMKGIITKSILKEDMKKRVTNIIKFITTKDETLPIGNVFGNTWNDDLNGGKVLGNILYYDDLNGGNVALGDGSDLSITGRKTIVVRGGNLYIKSNLINNNSSDILGIIVLKDENGNGGKLYIDTLVQKIDSIIYIDKSIISYNIDYDNGNTDTILKHEVDGSINNIVVQNQLYIYGTLFSENTIGGSRKDPVICPFYTKSIAGFTCDIKEAQKYDLNYLRSGYNNKYNSAYADYPVIIKYNPAVQGTPPPIFGK